MVHLEHDNDKLLEDHHQVPPVVFDVKAPVEPAKHLAEVGLEQEVALGTYVADDKQLDGPSQDQREDLNQRQDHGGQMLALPACDRRLGQHVVTPVAQWCTGVDLERAPNDR